MTVLDAQAVIALLRSEPAAEMVRQVITSPTVLPAVNAAEVMDILVRDYGHSPEVVARFLARLERTGLGVAPVTEQLGLLAGELRARYYHRKRSPVSLADCVAAATALTEQSPIATSDTALAAIVRAEGGEVRLLPDRHGNGP